MNLFEMPEMPMSALQAARLRFDVAKAAYDAASEAEDEFGDPVPHDIQKEYKSAKFHVCHEEEMELYRLKQQSPGAAPSLPTQ